LFRGALYALSTSDRFFNLSELVGAFLFRIDLTAGPGCCGDSLSCPGGRPGLALSGSLSEPGICFPGSRSRFLAGASVTSVGDSASLGSAI
jgi:hypothetical protein